MILTMAFSSFAHEYWFEPDNFFPAVKEKTAVRLFLGEGLKKEEEMPFLLRKTDRFELFSLDRVFNLRNTTTDDALPVHTFDAEKEGNYMLVMERNWSYITLEPDKFDEYLREDGMEYIIDERAKLGESQKPGSERYSRYIKGLMQVGQKRDSTFKKSFGLKLEIVPLENPYSAKIGENLGFQILFDGKPLVGRTIFADNRDGEQISKQRLRTDKNGKVKVKIDRKGVWLIRLVFMQRCNTECNGADWESFWGAFSFGVR